MTNYNKQIEKNLRQLREETRKQETQIKRNVSLLNKIADLLKNKIK